MTADSIQRLKIGILLAKKDIEHLQLQPTAKLLDSSKVELILIDELKSLKEYPKFDVIIHKISDYLKARRSNVKYAVRICQEFEAYSLNNPETIFLDPVSTVLQLADRYIMFSIMEKCTFQLNGIHVKVPKWTPLITQDDISNFKSLNFNYPIICKALCAGEGVGAHDMQLIFNNSHLKELSVFPSIAQEFTNHGGYLCKIVVMGRHYFVSTRPSVKDFPMDEKSLRSIDPIRFSSHEVTKLGAFSYLNNFQSNFQFKNSINGDKILDDDVTKEIIHTLARNIIFTFLGIDVLVTDGGKTYNLVDVNFLPSYDGVTGREFMMNEIIEDIIKNKSQREYWKVKG